MELLERDTFLADLERLLADAAAGRGRLVFVGGEAGVGKTAFVARVAESARKTARVLVGACDPMSTPRPLAPVLDIAATVGGTLERLLADSGQPRHRILRAILGELSGGLRPTLAVFEDAHWADEATLVRLVALGLRNGEIAERLSVTAKTVDHHVSAALSKLGARSRLEAVKEAARLGLLGAPNSPRREIQYRESSRYGPPRHGGIVVPAGRPGLPKGGRDASLHGRTDVSDGLRIPMTGEGAVACLGVVGRNADLGVTWIHSYVSDDKKKTYCVYDGPDPEAIRKAAQRNGLPVDSINKVSVLDPYFYV